MLSLVSAGGARTGLQEQVTQVPQDLAVVQVDLGLLGGGEILGVGRVSECRERETHCLIYLLGKRLHGRTHVMHLPQHIPACAVLHVRGRQGRGVVKTKWGHSALQREEEGRRERESDRMKRQLHLLTSPYLVGYKKLTETRHTSVGASWLNQATRH